MAMQLTCPDPAGVRTRVPRACLGLQEIGEVMKAVGQYPTIEELKALLKSYTKGKEVRVHRAAGAFHPHVGFAVHGREGAKAQRRRSAPRPNRCCPGTHRRSVTLPARVRAWRVPGHAQGFP